MIQSGEFLGRLKAGLPLIKNIIKLLAKSYLAPLGLTAAASAADSGMYKKNLRCWNSSIMISNDEMEDIMKIVKYLKDSGLLLNGVSEIIQNGTKEQKGGFLGMLLGTLGAILLGKMLTD